MRLIDADWIIQRIEVWRDFLAETYGENDEYVRCIDEVLMRLDDAPTADAEPVKPGHWTSSQGLAEVGEVQCSNCKTIYYVGDLYDVGETDENGMGRALMPNYCPHCGAKMEGEDV